MGHEGGTLAGALFFFCAECLEVDLARDPADFVLELEELEAGVLNLRPRSR